MREAHDQKRKGNGQVPPFWIRPRGHDGQPIDPRVMDASHRLWRWAYRHVQRVLRDAACAAELLEEVALEVSARLQVAPEVARNLSGYLITAFHHKVRSQILKESRLAYHGLPKELEEIHQLTAPDWGSAMHTELGLKSLLSHLPQEPKHMLHQRMLGFSWKAIGKFMGISANQAKSRFYYGMRKAHDTLLEEQAKRRSHEERK